MSQLSYALNKAATSAAFTERLKYALFLLATTVLLLPTPWLAVVIALTMLWYGAIGWTYRTAPAKWLAARTDAATRWLARKIMKDERDSPYLYSYLGIGLIAPMLFLGSYYIQVHYLDANTSWGWKNWAAALGYNVLNYGPYFVFFSQVATMIHKEGHMPKGVFKKPFRVFNNFHGHVLSLLYGHVPQGYPMGHMRIHHKHDNAAEDVTSTIHYDRSHASRFLIYLLEFALFWTGISVAVYHYRKGKMKEFRKMLAGMAAFYGFMAVVMYINLWFGVAYLLVPHLSCIFLLAAINYTWHAWTDPSEPKNIYKNSITVLNGQYNVYNEDYHVEHHKRPQTHWTEYPLNYAKHIEEYKTNRAIVFQDTQAFEIFFLILFNDFEKMADKFVDLNQDMSREDIIGLLKYRLQPATV